MLCRALPAEQGAAETCLQRLSMRAGLLSSGNLVSGRVGAQRGPCRAPVTELEAREQGLSRGGGGGTCEGRVPGLGIFGETALSEEFQQGRCVRSRHPWATCGEEPRYFLGLLGSQTPGLVQYLVALLMASGPSHSPPSPFPDLTLWEWKMETPSASLAIWDGHGFSELVQDTMSESRGPELGADRQVD